MKPAPKLAFVLYCWISAVAAPWTLQIVLVLTLFALPLFSPMWRLPSERAKHTARRFLAFLAILSIVLLIVNGLMFSGAGRTLIVGGIALNRSGVLFASTVALRLILLSASVLFFFLSTPMRAIADFIEDRGLPSALAILTLLSVHIVEMLPDRIHDILAAQEARGAPVRGSLLARFRSLIAVLGPLTVSSLAEAIERDHAYALRGLGSARILPSYSTASSASRWTWPLLSLSFITVAWRLLAWIQR